MIKNDKAFCVYICYGFHSEHNLSWQDLFSSDFLNFVDPIRDRKKLAQIKNQL